MALRCTAARLTLASHQFKALVLFYRQLLHREPAVLVPNVYAEFHLPDLKLGIFQPKVPASGLAELSCQSPLPTPVRLSTHVEALSPTGMSLCLDVDDLEEAIAHLTQLGYPPPDDIMTASHGREIYAYDPDGNWLILHQAAITYNKTWRSF